MNYRKLSFAILSLLLVGSSAINLEASALPKQGKPIPPASTPKPLALVFSQRTKTDPVTGYEFPSDMPNVRFPSGYDGCSAEEKTKIKEAWAVAHFYMWRADQVMNYLERNESRRQEMWVDGYVNQIENNQGQYINYSPRGWFGPYDNKRFQKVQGAIHKVWSDRFLGKTFTVKCRTKDSNKGAHPCYVNNPQTGNKPGANHIVYGTINFCQGWFDDRTSWRAKGVIHEVFHWLKLPNSALWVTDIHDYWEGSCGKYRAARAMYGDRAAYIANEGGCKGWNYNRTPINNDNYALFAYSFGKAVWEGKTVNGDTMTQFPSKSFNW